MHQQQRWIKKMAWPVRSFLFLAVMLLCSSVPALASSGPKTAYPKPFATWMTGQHSLAVTCSGNTCNGRDPYQTGCAQSFYPVTSKEIYPLLVELEYSRDSLIPIGRRHTG